MLSWCENCVLSKLFARPFIQLFFDPSQLTLNFKKHSTSLLRLLLRARSQRRPVLSVRNLPSRLDAVAPDAQRPSVPHMLTRRAPRQGVVDDVQTLIEHAARRQLLERTVVASGTPPQLRRRDQLLFRAVRVRSRRQGQNSRSRKSVKRWTN